jgi:FkbM family methyltransferase
LSLFSFAKKSPKVIYDFGSNNGDDIPYYLLKGDAVVALEANPALAETIRSRFADEIRDKRVFVENCVLTVDPATSFVPFYLHKTIHVKSQFPRPPEELADDYKEVQLPARPLKEILAQYGEPHYIKLDLEYYDAIVLEALFRDGVRPPFISAESHTPEVFCMMVAAGKYRSFKLVDGPSVAERFRDHPVRTARGEARYSFPFHSAGPFGEDIPGPWMNAENMFKLLAFQGFGWKDLHATTTEEPDPTCVPKLQVNLSWSV